MVDKKRRKYSIGWKGFTLVEVLVAFVILLMASHILLFGVSFAARVGERAENIEMARREIGEHLAEKSGCISGTARLEMGDLCEDIACDGWLYTGSDESDLPIDMNMIWVDETVFVELEDEIWLEEPEA